MTITTAYTKNLTDPWPLTLCLKLTAAAIREQGQEWVDWYGHDRAT